MTKKLLIIEDDQSTVRLLSMALERKGYTIQVASNGLVGLKMARSQPPDAILLDLMLPGVDGFEVLNQIRDLPAVADVPVLVVSAKSSASDKERAAELGAESYLQKPYRINDLYAQLEKAIGEKKPAAQPSSRYIIFVGSRSSDVANVVVRTGVALAQSVANVITMDLHAYAVEHVRFLDLTPPSSPIALGQIEPDALLHDHALHHQSGLTLISNLTGSGDIGQPTREEVKALFSSWRAEQRLVLVDVPLRPTALLQDLAADSALVVIVGENQPAALPVARSLVDLLHDQGLAQERLGFALIQHTDEPVDALPEIAVLANLPGDLAPDHPGWQKLAQSVLDRLGPMHV